MHAKQEGATDEPYTWETSLLSDLSINESKTGDAKTGTANYDLNLKALRLITNSLEAGGQIDYEESSFKVEKETNTSRKYVLSLVGKYNFGDLNADESLFFVTLRAGFGASSSKTGDDKTEASLTTIAIGLGMHYFVDTNVALTGETAYELGTSKAKGATEPTKLSNIHLLSLGFSLFL